MLINTNNISIYGATLIEREFTNHEVVNVNDWLDGAPSPVFLREYTRYKNISLVFLVEAATEQIILDKIGLMVKQLRKCTIKFSDLSFFYDAHLEGVIDMKKINNKAYRVEVELLAHNTYTAEVIETKSNFSWMRIQNPGELETAAQIIITPTVNIASLTINGASKNPIVLKNLLKDKAHTIDGYTLRYLKAGANDIANYDAFEFPIFKPGQVQLDFSATSFTVVTKYFPKFN